MGPNLAAALVAAQAEMPAVAKLATNPHFKSKFASLDSIIEAVRPVLAKHGLAVLQSATGDVEGKGITVSTTIVHTSGEEFVTGVYIPLAKVDPQGAGSALTYGRRYNLAAALCLATEDDDDGLRASKPAPVRATKPAVTRSEPDPSPSTVAFPPVPKWLGLAKDRPMPFGNTKGRALSEHSKKALESWQAWCLKHPEGTEDLLHDIRVVLADMALGEVPASGVSG